MRAFILLTGDELIEGRVADTNGAFLARALTDMGIEVTGMGFVGDDLPVLVKGIRDGLLRADILAMSGGLGGTLDDLTREALAETFSVPLEHSAAARENVFAFYTRVGRKLPAEPWPESMAPKGARIHANLAGLAPGIELEIGEKRVFAFPGVPSELEYLVNAGIFDSVRPKDRACARADVGIAGWRESDAARAIGDLMARGRNPIVGIGAKEGVLMLHVRARAGTIAEAEALLARDLGVIHATFGNSIYTTRGETPAESIARRLRDLGRTLAVAESLTGGWIGHLLTEIPGMSAILKTDVVAYTPEMKTALLGVPADMIESEGVVSKAVAIAMATGVRRAADTDFAIATTGVAGPTGGDPKTPIGTAWVAVVDREGRSLAETRVHIGGRATVKKRAAVHVLDLLRRFLTTIGLDADERGS